MKNDDINPNKVQTLLNDAITGLDRQDLAERIAWCIQNGVHGATMHPEDGVIEFKFGGRRLALVPVDALCGDGPLDVTLEVEREFVPDDIDIELERLTDDGDETND
jgi:hypothetical protein